MPVQKRGCRQRIQPAYWPESRRQYEKKWYFRVPLEKRRKINRVLCTMVKIRRIIRGYKVKSVGCCSLPESNQPVILVLNHIGKMDVEVVSEVLKKQYFLLLREFKNLKGTLNGLAIALSGVIYVDPFDRQDRNSAKEKMIAALKEGANVMLFPEGVWNLSPNVLVLPLFWGVIEIAHRANTAILPIGVQQFGRNFYVTFGKMFPVNALLKDPGQLTLIEKQSILSRLRDEMATLIWTLLEERGVYRRSGILPDEHERYIAERLKEWPFLDIEELRQFQLESKLETKHIQSNI